MGNDNRSYYLAMWETMLRAFLGWSAAQVTAWARETGKLAAMENPDSILYNQTPQYWVKGLLIPPHLRTRLAGAGLAVLEQRILDALRDEVNRELPADTDWMPYRDRVQHILAEYGEHLPDPTG